LWHKAQTVSEIQAQIDHIAADAIVTEANCDLGSMVYRTWQPWGDQMGGELLVMAHGGSGSWTHWLRNLATLSDYYELLVPDLPSLGDSATLVDASPYEVASLYATTLRQLVGPRRFHLVAFSWGCVVTALAARELGDQVKSIFLVGPASTGKPPEKSIMQPLVARTKEMTAFEVANANRENLARLMIHDRKKIDPLAVELQTQNTQKARYNSPKYAMSDLLLEGLRDTSANLLVVYGENDTVSVPFLTWRETQIRSVRPDLQFEIAPDVGHWLQYEQPDWFNQRTVAWIEANIFS
jgi:pimeloyl-ACP methyl ester carboxylesterase